MMWGYYGSWGGMVIMMLSTLFWVALLGVVLFLVARSRLGSQWSAHVDSPRSLSAMEVLEQRYARGEIDDATFRRMRDELRAGQLQVTLMSSHD